MIVIQIIIIIVALAIIVFVLGGRQTYVARAWKKIALCFLAIAMIVAVLFPDTTNQLAHFVGVGRGADLLLYVLVLAFVVSALNNYLYHQREKDTVYRIARKVALMDANERYNIRKK